MGEVYLAEDTRIARKIAIKVIKSDVIPYPDTTTAQEVNRLFLREAKAIATLQHPHILPLFDYGDDVVHGNTLSYMVMPYCQEGSLDIWLHRRGSISLPSLQNIAQILEQTADALDYAHKQNIVHQDVKLPNFLIRGWRTPDLPDLLLTDFGIAKFVSANSSTSQSIRGTPTYMAPEQWEGHPTPATDQYALAIMIYQLLTGYAPFQGGPGQIMYQHLTAEPPPPSIRQKNLSPAIDAVILKALMKNPEERFPSVLSFAQAFQKALGHGFAFEVEGEKTTIRNAASANIERTQTENDTILATPHETLASGPSFIPNESADIHSAPAFNNESSSWNNKGERISPASKSHQQGVLWSKAFFIALLVLLLIGGSIGAFLYAMHPMAQRGSSNRNIDQATLNNHTTDGTATVVARATHVAQATTQAQNVLATATAQVVSRNPYPPNTGTLTFADPLSDNTRGYNWETGERDQGFCSFIGGSYHPNVPLSGYFHSCLAQSNDLTDFTYEVQMNLLTGSAGGIVFRANRATIHFYYFTIDRNGNYLLKSYYDKNGGSAVLATGSGLALRGNDLIGVVAQGSSISLYVNRQRVGQVNDGTNTHGQIGVVVYEGEAAFNNAKVWTL
ncbi:MAG: hypothetical protein PVS3B3_34220 [Ktedonobacteraceae bacterium]